MLINGLLDMRPGMTGRVDRIRCHTKKVIAA
jgi:hypothetical protein